jgi:hypothetical protein
LKFNNLKINHFTEIIIVEAAYCYNLVNVIKLTKIYQVPKSHLWGYISKRFAHCYHLVNVISFSLSQSDHIKQLLVFLLWPGDYCGHAQVSPCCSSQVSCLVGVHDTWDQCGFFRLIKDTQNWSGTDCLYASRGVVVNFIVVHERYSIIKWFRCSIPTVINPNTQV